MEGFTFSSRSISVQTSRTKLMIVVSGQFYCIDPKIYRITLLAPVVQRVDRTILCIIRYPVGNSINFHSIYAVNSAIVPLNNLALIYIFLPSGIEFMIELHYPFKKMTQMFSEQSRKCTCRVRYFWQLRNDDDDGNEDIANLHV